MLWSLLLFVLGVALITVEFLLPGLICGILGIAFLVISTVLGINAYPEYTLFIIIGELIGACCGVGLGFYILARTSLGRTLFLDTNQELDEGYSNVAQVTIAAGARGRVLTPLRPSGTIEVDGERFDAVSDGDLIDIGRTVQVTEVHGNRVVVETAPDLATNTEESAS